MTVDTFIAANSSKGFYSFFSELINDLTLNHVYLIKGGPGCGKSTFMKKVSQKLSSGHFIELIHCSSDPESLDGIVIKEKGIAIIDATPPHSFDMKFPGAFDSIIDLSTFWDDDILIKNKNEIINVTKTISKMYSKTYGLIKSAGQLYDQIHEYTSECVDTNKIVAFIKKVIKQNAFTPLNKNGKITKRFISAITYKGVINFDTPQKCCENIILLKDDALIASHIISKFLTYFTKSGYDVTVYFNPLCPDTKIDHIIVPQLKLGIFSTNSIFEYNQIDPLQIIKTVNTKNLIDKDLLNINKNKISLIKKLTSELLRSASEELTIIKSNHDILESYYIKSIDYKNLNNYTDQFISTL